MIAQQGRVIAVEGDDAVVRIGATSGCPACDAGKGCGAGIFGRLLRKHPITVHVPNRIGACVGQPVAVGIPEERFLALVFRLYGLPLLTGLLGAALGFAIALRIGLQGLGADLWTLACAVGSSGLTLIWVRHRLREFPLQAAVHLLHAPGPDCNGANLRDGRGSAGDEFESFGR